MTKDLDKGNNINLRVDLKDNVSEIFRELIEERNFQTYSEAIRYCIMEAHNKAEYKLEEPYLKKIKQLLQYDYVKNDLLIHSVQHFIEKSLDSYTQLVSEQIESILSFEVRKHLTDDELPIALTFIECQEENYANHVTVDELAKKMNRRNLKTLKEVLDKFVHRGILSKMKHESQIYYHADSLKSS